MYIYFRLNATHIWVGGGFVPQFVGTNPSEDDSEKDQGNSKNITLNMAWFFDGFSWISVKEMDETRNFAACSIVYDQNGEVHLVK